MQGKVIKTVELLDDDRNMVQAYAIGDCAKLTCRNGDVISGTVYDAMASGITIKVGTLLKFVYFEEIAEAGKGENHED